MNSKRYRYPRYREVGYKEEEIECSHPQEKKWRFIKEHLEYRLCITEWENPCGGGTSAEIIPDCGARQPNTEQNWPEGNRRCETSSQVRSIEFFCSMCPLEVVERKAAELWAAVRDIYIPCF